ncbi:methyl-accepting chemotaxis protein [Methylobacterium aerolatum]|uniref:Methyl-accepting chemotaxis protein n=1 Tax=Methylobacterium aerolatum TaxID=418708 RepID=A0ABU0I425_9HYPH|nr:methyl-accepting chemotaxis protein [Methylobacterium aerolatum]MDQ0448827.1 methyl-accepting chemotaxis protein [Methylobacterium aerolatum]
MFSLKSRQASSPSETRTSSPAVDHDRARLLAAMEQLAHCQDLDLDDLPDGIVGQALSKIQQARATQLNKGRLQLAAVAKEASEAAINIGWTTYDVGDIAQSTGTAASAIEEMAASMNEVAENSQSAGRSADSAQASMQACTNDVRQAREAMQAIELRTHQIDERLSVLQAAVSEIGSMAGTIAAISGQTNLLALNATIEAARAGEAGKGFAVVAAEVKALSGQTAKSTEQIRAGLMTLQAEMEHIAKAVAESRAAVERGGVVVASLGAQVEDAGSQIARSNEMGQALATALEQQRAATSEISRSVNGIAEKAAKTRTEIDAITKRLLKAEAMAQAGLSEAGGNATATELSRLAADLGVWKRTLASVLLGATTPERSLAISRELAARKAVEALRHDPKADQGAVQRFLDAEAKARAEAGRMIDALTAQNWDVGTPAYRAAGAAMKDMLSAAGDLLR